MGDDGEWQTARGRGKTFSSNYIKAGKRNVATHGGENSVANPAVEKAIAGIKRWEQNENLRGIVNKIYASTHEILSRGHSVSSSLTSTAQQSDNTQKIRILALGLGSFCENYNAQVQMALYKLLKEKLQTAYVIEGYVFDPVMNNSEDKDVAQKSGLIFDGKLLEKKYFFSDGDARVTTILYMPTCPGFLYWEVLKCLEECGKDKVILLGNDVLHMAKSRTLTVEERASGVPQQIVEVAGITDLHHRTAQLQQNVFAVHGETICTSKTKDAVSLKFGGSLHLQVISVMNVEKSNNKVRKEDVDVPGDMLRDSKNGNYESDGSFNSSSSLEFYPYPLVPTKFESGMEVFVNLKSMQLDSRATVMKVEKNFESESDVLHLKFKSVTDQKDEGLKRKFKTLKWPEDKKRIKTERKRREYCGHLPVYVTRSTIEFRNCCLTQIEVESEVILEVGCSTGMCTMAMMQKTPKKQLGVDVSTEVLRKAYERCMGVLKDVEGEHITGMDTTISTGPDHTDISTFSKDSTVSARTNPNVDVSDTRNSFIVSDDKNSYIASFQVGTSLDIFFFDVFLSDFETVLRQHVNSVNEITMLTIDIGGDRNGSQVLKALSVCQKKLPNLRVVVIKSEDLADHGFEKLNLAWQTGESLMMTHESKGSKKRPRTSQSDDSDEASKPAPRVPKELLETKLAEETHSTNIQLKKKLRRARKQVKS